MNTHGPTSASGAKNSSSGGQKGSYGACGEAQKDDGTFTNVNNKGLEDWSRQEREGREEKRGKKSKAKGGE